MSRRHAPPAGQGITRAALALAARPQGASVPDLVERGFGEACTITVLSRLVREQRLHVARVPWLRKRYFSTAAAAEAWATGARRDGPPAQATPPTDTRRPAPTPLQLRITRAAPLVDRRYHVELPPGGGPLMAEWRRLRGLEAPM